MTPFVATTSGMVCGLAVEAHQLLDDSSSVSTVYAYLGIPFAESTAGQNRWAPPVPLLQPQMHVLATDFGPACPQPPQFANDVPQSEDCLSLNVWTPVAPGEDGKSLPVMVFIQGGVFFYGTTQAELFNGHRLAATGRAVIVTANYRLGALGFLAGIEGLEGNYGLLDQQQALRWVADNIRAFGGDPDRVTLFGESAGAMSVGLHLVAPSSARLFRAAIMESNPYGLPYKTLDQAAEFAKTLKFDLGCELGGLACMRSTPFTEVVAHQDSLLMDLEGWAGGFADIISWTPVIDGKLVPNRPSETAITKPVIIGTNRDEGTSFASTKRIELWNTKEIPRIEYVLAVDVMFPGGLADKIKGRDRYRPHDGDNTDVFANVLTDYLFTCPNRHVMRLAKGNVYAYQFTHPPSYVVWDRYPICAPENRKVCHGYELPFVFGIPTIFSPDASGNMRTFTDEEQQLTRLTVGYWTRFAESMDPNFKGAPPWPQFSEDNPVRLILHSTVVTNTNLGANCDFWDSVGYDLPGLVK